MKTVSAIAGLLCIASNVVLAWRYDWRAGLVVLALMALWGVGASRAYDEDKRELSLLKRAIAFVADERDKALRLHKQRRWDAIYWFCGFLVMSVLALCFARKLDRIADCG